jgi:hypothetical protein
MKLSWMADWPGAVIGLLLIAGLVFGFLEVFGTILFLGLLLMVHRWLETDETHRF